MHATNKGLKLWNEFKKGLRKKIEIGRSTLTLVNYNFAILVKNCGEKVKSGMRQRDADIIFGARGAMIIMFKRDA